MDLQFIFALLGLILISFSGQTIAKDYVPNNTSNNTNHSVHHSEIFRVVDWKFSLLKTYFIYTFFIIIVIVMKILYFRIPRLSVYIPESCILVIVGVLFGLIVRFTDIQDIQYFKLTPRLFFSVLLPPIILESSYSLYHRNFLDNILSILVFAVFGTLLNFIIIGFSLYGLSRFGAMLNLNLSLLHCLLFSSLIVAVDPVAVLAIFQDLGVNPDLYYLVFGESLLNDAVTVVLYEMMQEFAMMPEIGAGNIVLGFVSFFTVSLGGMLIGVIVGVISCLIIRLMDNKNTLLMEPILLMSTGYFAFLSGDVFSWSGIISCIACGLVQASYAFYSISEKSRLVLKRFVKILASICEALIFLFLGVELVVGKLSWDTSFSITALVLCLATRFLVTFALSGFVNKIHMSLRNIPLKEKVIISYGGLRGAVAFSLAMLIKPESLPQTGINEEIIITTTLFIILFTIIIQGITVKPLVSVLQIARKNESHRLSLLDELNESLIDAAICGTNAILGRCGRNYVYTLVERFNDKYIRPFLQGNSFNSNTPMLVLNEKINHAIVTRMNRPASSHDLHKQIPGSYINLLNLPQKSTMTLDKERPAPEPVRRPSNIAPMSVIKPIKRLQPLLKRVSSMSVDDDRSYTLLTSSMSSRISTLNPVHNRAPRQLKRFLSDLDELNQIVDDNEHETYIF